MKFKGHITTFGASVARASGDTTRRVTLELHEEEPAAFASLDYLLGKTLSIQINLEQEELNPLGRQATEKS